MILFEKQENLKALQAAGSFFGTPTLENMRGGYVKVHAKKLTESGKIVNACKIAKIAPALGGPFPVLCNVLQQIRDNTKALHAAGFNV